MHVGLRLARRSQWLRLRGVGHRHLDDAMRRGGNRAGASSLLRRRLLRLVWCNRQLMVLVHLYAVVYDLLMRCRVGEADRHHSAAR